MSEESDNKEDLSSSFLWTVFAVINDINDCNAEAIIDWLKDRSSVLIWFTSIITGVIVLLTLFGNKPGFNDPSSIALSVSLLLMFFFYLVQLNLRLADSEMETCNTDWSHLKWTQDDIGSGNYIMA